jgi:hypothetical protein
MSGLIDEIADCIKYTHSGAWRYATAHRLLKRCGFCHSLRVAQMALGHDAGYENFKCVVKL